MSEDKTAEGAGLQYIKWNSGTSTLMETPNVPVFEEYVHKNSFYDYKWDNEGSKADKRHSEFPIILVTVVVLSLIGNILVIVISVFCVRLRSLTSIFILNLALSDLLFTVGLVFWVCEFMWGLTLGTTVVDFTFSAGFYSSIVFLVLMSVQQYATMVHPHSGWKKGCCFTLGLICAWALSISAALIDTVYISNYLSIIFNPINLVIIYKAHIVFVYAFLFLGICYFKIMKTIFKSPRNKKNRTVGLILILVATFFICWAPLNIVNFLNTLSYSTRVLKDLNYGRYICHILVYSRCCFNPIIYGLFGIKFSKAMREIFHRQASPNSEQMGMEEHHSNRPVSV